MSKDFIDQTRNQIEDDRALFQAYRRNGQLIALLSILLSVIFLCAGLWFISQWDGIPACSFPLPVN